MGNEGKTFESIWSFTHAGSRKRCVRRTQKNGTRSQHSSIQKERVHRLQIFYFAESFDEPGGKCAIEIRHSFPYFFLLVRISEFLYANFSSTCVTVKTYPQKLARPLRQLPFTKRSNSTGSIPSEHRGHASVTYLFLTASASLIGCSPLATFSCRLNSAVANSASRSAICFALHLVIFFIPSNELGISWFPDNT